MHRFSFVKLCALTMLISATTFAQELPKKIPGLDTDVPKPKVMIIGTFHFNNPGLDYTKAERDSILSEKRQKEVRELIDRLKAFKPTKIAIEDSYSSTKINEQYSLYLQNQFALKESETYQVAFRMAKEANHKMLYPIDWKKDMDFDALLKSAQTHGQTKFLERFQQAMGFITKMQADANKYTVVEQLRMMNDLQVQERMHSLYMLLAEAGKGTDYTGADVVAGWYERNLKIAMNVVRTADSPDDRILVIIGAGHLKLLREFLKESPSVEIVEASSYLK
jgi:pheromone shutdown protein TraB